ncbi:MAG: Fe-S cluster assembly protein SufD [Bacteroidales bacterium]|nr:Fe-S cluster assembly protein SufD [Bacteroidales bacterium]
MDTLEALETADKYIDLFHQNREQIGEGDPQFMQDLREEAIRSFEQAGFPQRKQDKYEHTHLEPVFNEDLSFHFNPREIEFDDEEIFKCDVPMLDSHVLMILNGFFYNPAGSNLQVLDNGIIYGSLKEAIQRYPDLVAKYMGGNASIQNEAFVSLNTAFFQDGIFLYVPENQEMDKSIQIIHLLLSDKNQMVHHRNLFVVERNASAQVIVCDHTLSPHMFLTNSVTEAYTGENADLDVLRLQNEHNNSCQVTNTWISQERSSRCQHGTFTLHGGMVRNNLHVKLKGEGAEINALGLFLIDKNQHVDSFTVIEHDSPHCTSNQHYKGVLNDMSTGAFNGKIHVHPYAQKTEAFQTNNNILLSDMAKMHTKPQLEIYADDVKCSHGATVGQLDEDALFYLQSRGIPKDEGRLMLMNAFATNVISQIKQPVLQDRISDLVGKRLRGELSRCNNCAMHCQD